MQSVDSTCQLTSNAVTGLLQCTANLPDGRSNALGNVVLGAADAEPKKVAEYFSKKVVPLADPSKHKLLVLVLREMTIEDEDINENAIVELVSGTTKNALRKQSKFVLADFLAGVFLYTTSIDNRIGKEAAGLVTSEFVQSFSGLEKGISFVTLDAETPPAPSQAFDTYLSRVEEKYSQAKTLLYFNQPRPFYSFYLPNHLRQTLGRDKYDLIKKVTAKSLTDTSNFIILDGMGGVGKTMMMRHLLLSAIAEYKDFQHIPVFISLKDYNDCDLFDFVYQEVAVFSEGLTKATFKENLENGRVLLLFDGLDEIYNERRHRFERQLEVFTDKYSKSRYVISSRPYQSLLSFSRFTVLKIEPFTREQAIGFIDKIAFHPEEPNLKKEFRDLLVGSLYSTHRSFIENPLLLTILLLTFEKFASIPDKMHIFYRKAFITLSETHDASKVSYKRHYKTGMIPEMIADYFAEFCFQTYIDAKFEFVEEEFERYFDNLRINDQTTTASSFAYDLCANLCLMLYDGKYQFTHRSFQEYFCALFFSRQNDKFLARLGQFFEDRHHHMRGDQVFNMLYDMIPDKVEASIFIPFLQTLFDACDSGDGYWSFLAIIYPCIRYTKGKVDECPSNIPESFLFEFIVSLVKPNHKYECDDLPKHSDFIIDKYGYVQVDEDCCDLVKIESIPEEYPWLQEKPEVVGCTCAFDVSKIRHSRFYGEIREMLEDDAFIFKSQYNVVRQYFEEMQARQKENEDYFAGLF